MKIRDRKQWRSHWGGKGGQSTTPDSDKFAKNREKEGENQEKSGKIRKNRGKNQEKSGKKEEKSGRKGKNREVSFTLPLLTDRAGYATDRKIPNLKMRSGQK